MKGGTPMNDEEDYNIVYKHNDLGFDLFPGVKEKNAIVGEVYGEHALMNVYPNSLVVSIDSEWLIGHSFQYCCETIYHALETKPPYVIRFRCKKKTMKKNLKSGSLLIQIVGADDLASSATHAP
eukprot:UN05446